MTLQQLKYVITIADCGSMNEAAKQLYLSQPSLSETVMSLEEEIGIELFIRTNRGIRTTVEGEEFLSYARQVVEQYQLLDDKYISHTNSRKKFCVSMQHYTFAVKAFVVVAKEFGFDEYEFAVRETKTAAVIEDVKNFKSEIGILYRNDFNAKVLDKLLDKNELDFHELFTCNTCVYLWNGHPLAENKKITMKELEEYPCLSFEQGLNNSFYLSEEVLSTYSYKKIIKVNDRATALNLMVGMNAYTLCSGIICEELNGSDYSAVPLDSYEKMTIGYVTRKGINLSKLGNRYIEELKKYRDNVM